MSKELSNKEYYRKQLFDSLVNDQTEKSLYFSKKLVEELKKELNVSKPKRELKEKEYIFNFINGGWNTIYAKTKKGAIKKANEKYKNDSLVLIPDPESFRVSTEVDYNACLRTFN